MVKTELKKETHLLISLLGVYLSVILLVPVTSALGVPPSQEDIALTLERGSSYSFFFLVNDVEEEVALRADGEIEDWITFGEDKEAEISLSPSFLTNIVLVTISIPDDAELDEYAGEIEADSTRLSSLDIKVTLELSDAKAYSKLKDVDEEVGRLRDRVESLTDSLNSMRAQLATLEQEVSDRMQEIYDYQKNLTALENEKKDLESERAELGQDLQNLQAMSDDLEQSNRQLNEMTGMLVGTQLPGMFFAGVVLGIVAVTLIVKRSHVAKKIKSRVHRIKERGKGERFSYKFRP